MWYPRWESNPNQQFRKLLFYPLNYRDSDFIGKITKIVCISKDIVMWNLLCKGNNNASP